MKKSIGYLQSKLIKSPLKFNTQWNEMVNECENETELYELCQSYGTDSDTLKLLSFLD